MAEELATEQQQSYEEDAPYCCPAEFNENESLRKLYVAGLPKESEDEDIKQFFSQYGEIEDSVVFRKDDKPKAFGFITYKYCDDVDELLLHNREDRLTFGDAQLQLKRAVPKDDKSGTAHMKVKQLYLSNVTPDMTEESLRQYLARRHPTKYGEVTKILFIKKKDESGNPTTKNKGFGFIDVSTEDLADRIALGEATFNIGGMSRAQNIVKAMPREQAIATLGNRNNRGGAGGGPGSGGRGRGGRGGGRGGRGGNNTGYGGNYGGGNYGGNYGYENSYEGGYESYGGYDDGSGYYGYGTDYSGYGQSWDYDNSYDYTSDYSGGYTAPQRGGRGARGGARGGRGARGGPRGGGQRYQPY